MHTKICLNKGQTLPIIIVLMSLALIIGIGISTSFTQNLRNKTNVDFSYRAEAVAQSLLERLLLKDFNELKDYVTYNNCNNECILAFEEDSYFANATAKLNVLGESDESYQVKLNQTSTVEVNLNGYEGDGLHVCWNNRNNTQTVTQDSPQDSSPLNQAFSKPSVIASLVYEQNDDYLFKSYAYNATTATNYANDFLFASTDLGYDNCFQVDTDQNPLFLRLRSVYASTDAFIVPLPAKNLPSQGIRITSYGYSGDVEKVITAFKTQNYMPVEFDYALFQESQTESLTNF